MGMVPLDKKQQEFVVKHIENGKTIDEIINVFNKKYERLIGERTVRRIAHKYRAKFANGTTPMTVEQRKLLKQLIISKNNKTECQEAILKKFDRRVDLASIKRFAKREGLKIDGKYIGPDQYTESETQTLSGLRLVGAGMKRILAELPTRSTSSIMRKLRFGNAVGITSDSVKESVKQDLINGSSDAKVAKKYKISAKYVKEFRNNIKESSVKIQNLKRWEKMDVNAILDHIEEGQKKLRSLDSEQGNADITIKTGNKYVAIAFMSDFHLENIYTDIKQLRKDFSIIKNTKDFYMGFGGDLADNAISGPHPDGIVEAVVPPKAARLAAGRLFDELEGKVLYTILGCHDNWDLANDYNLVEHISRKLRVPYLGHGGDVNLTIKNHSTNKSVFYSMHARHKFRGSSGLNNGTGCCKNILRDIDSKFEIVSVGHNHFSEIKLEHYLGKLRVFIRNGSYKREDRYSKMLGYKANDFNIQIPVVLLNTKTKEMKVASGINSAAEMLKALNK
jgi:transposase